MSTYMEATTTNEYIHRRCDVCQYSYAFRYNNDSHKLSILRMLKGFGFTCDVCAKKKAGEMYAARNKGGDA